MDGRSRTCPDVLLDPNTISAPDLNLAAICAALAVPL